jgi:hypothetical protein
VTRYFLIVLLVGKQPQIGRYFDESTIVFIILYSWLIVLFLFLAIGVPNDIYITIITTDLPM